MPNDQLTAERARALLAYDPETGELRWRASRGSARAGRVTGCRRQDGYLLVGVDGQIYRAHRLAWLIVHGSWPVEHIDHRNGIRDDNRLANLREASRADNSYNRRVSKLNTSGVTGVCWRSETSSWFAQIKVKGRTYSLGLYDNFDDAVAARRAAADRVQGEFAPHLGVDRE